MKWLKLFLFDMFFIISSVIGVGFATGKEIEHFFLGGKSVWLAVGVFFVVFTALTWYFLYIKNKYNVTTLTQLNKLAFGKNFEIGNIVLIILFIVTNAAMLAGCDNIVHNYFGLNLPIVSVFLSVITFFVVLGGINKIKVISNIVMPALIVIIMLNVFANADTFNISLNNKAYLDIAYPALFCFENFITIIAVLIKTKSKPKHLSIMSGLVLAMVIALSAIAIYGVSSDMPLLSTAKNVGNIFFVIYLVGVLFALFITLQISAYNCLEICTKNKQHKYFVNIMILLISQTISYLGFTFIVQYLYSAIGILGGIYLLALIIRLIMVNRRK